DFFNSKQNNLTEPAYKFYLRDKVAFAKAEEFINANFETKDTESGQFQVLLLYQDLLKTHVDDKTPDALIDADLKRLRFAYDNAVIANKEALYEKALEDLAAVHLDHPAYAEIVFEIARLYEQKGYKYQPNPEQIGKLDLLKAYNLCTQAITKFPESIGANYCRNLQANLLGKELQLSIENVNLPNAAVLTSIKYRNVEKAFLKVVEIGYNDEDKIVGKSQKEIVSWLNRQKTVQQKEVSLPQEGDYRSHRTEIDLEALPFGYYGVLVADNADFSGAKNAVGYTFTHVSNLASWARTSNSATPELVVVNRNSGQPQAGVTVELFSREYNSLTRRYNYKKSKAGLSDDRGMVKLPIAKRESFRIKLTQGNDVLFLDDNYSNYFYDRVGPSQTHTHFFLDRAIYRPGQTVYFKAIVIEQPPKGMPTIQANKPITITFSDVNGQKVDAVSLVTNEYGTVNGSFQAPSTGLLGNMNISSSLNGSQYFRVEEYKRPKFEVTFNPIQGSYKLGDELTVEGVAKAFAGNNIDNAQVQYRVVRKVRFPYRPYYWSRYNPYQRPDMEIANGVTTTDANGKFTIDFEALPDESIPADKKPVFTYEIVADVTDITGETQSNTCRTKVGYVALTADIAVPEKVEKSNPFVLKITTENLAGEPEPATVEVIVHQLKTPELVYKKREWEKPDTYVLSAEEFSANFPNIAYKNEDEKEQWRADKALFREEIDTRLRRLWQLPVQEWEAGQYELRLTAKDKYGQEIEVIKYF
ncbi:MAG: MG2 domain-containing protein, partial [Bacteroidota bacterium]